MASPAQRDAATDLERIARLLPAKHLRALADQLETAERDRADGELQARIHLSRGRVDRSSYRQPELEL